MTLATTVRTAAGAYGRWPALIAAGGDALTYADLDRRSDAVAVGLAAGGLGTGAAVGLVLPSDPSYVLAYVALAKIGAITAGVNPRLSPIEQQAVLDRLAPDLTLGPGDVATLEREGEGRRPPTLAADPDREVAVVFTSGTTGAPKGAVFRNRHLDTIDRIDAGELAAASGGPMLASTQFAHVGFMTKLPWYLRIGATLCLMDRWRADEALRLVAQHRMATVGGVAAQIALMLRVPDFDDRDLSCVRAVVVGGGPSPPALVAEARRRFGAPYSIRYSSTESGGVGTATAFDADDEEALHTVGRPRPGVAVAIGDSGEVLLRSPAVMDRYWRDPGATAAALVDGWLRTDDVGELDGRGCLRLTGRTTDMYIRGGYNVHPAPVEAVLLEHPAVAAVAIVHRPDPVMGEVGVAVVVPLDATTPPTLDDLRRFGASRLAAHELPEALEVVTALPLTAGDKVDRRALTLGIRGVGSEASSDHGTAGGPGRARQ